MKRPDPGLCGQPRGFQEGHQRLKGADVDVDVVAENESTGEGRRVSKVRLSQIVKKMLLYGDGVTCSTFTNLWRDKYLGFQSKPE